MQRTYPCCACYRRAAAAAAAAASMDPQQRRAFVENGYLVIPDAISPATVNYLNARFDDRLAEEMPAGALAWYLELATEDIDPDDGTVKPRRLWHNDLIAPPKVAAVLRELCGSLGYGHLHPDCPPEHHGRFRLDHDNAVRPGGPASYTL